jgi:hypothetical protein
MMGRASSRASAPVSRSRGFTLRVGGLLRTSRRAGGRLSGYFDDGFDPDFARLDDVAAIFDF